MTDYAELCELLREAGASYLDLRDAADAIEALVAERDALREDAERYRWLRQIANRIHDRAEHVPHVSVYFPRVPRSLNGWVNDAPQFADLDAAIDAARREEK